MEVAVKCAICGKEFMKKRSDMICCSKKCRKKLYNSKDYLPRRNLTETDIAKAWNEFKNSIGYNELEKVLKLKSAKSLCSTCIWGCNGVCIMPKCFKKQELIADILSKYPA